MDPSTPRTVTLDLTDPMAAGAVVNALREYVEAQLTVAEGLQAAADVECVDHFDLAAAARRAADDIDRQLGEDKTPLSCSD